MSTDKIINKTNIRGKMHYKIKDLDYIDIDAITKLYVDSVHIHFKNTIVDEELRMWTYKGESKEFEKNLNEKNLKVRVLYEKMNDIVGFTRFGEDEKESEIGWIDLIFVKDEYQGNGFGKILFIDAVKKLKEMGFRKIHLWSPTLGKSHGFYVKLHGNKNGRKINKIGFDLTEYTWNIDSIPNIR